MSIIGKNIRKIRGVKGMNQTQFAELFKLSRASIGAYEEGRAEPKISTLMEIANYFSISLDKLLKKELTVNELYHFDIFSDQTDSPKQVGSKTNGALELPILIPVRFTEYIQNLGNQDFVDALPSISGHPMIFRGEQLFEAPTDSSAGWKEGDILICSKRQNIKSNAEFSGIAVTDNAIAFGNFELKGKSLIHTNMDSKFKLAEVKEFWKVNGVLSYNLNSHAKESNLVSRVSRLEDLVSQLLATMK